MRTFTTILATALTLTSLTGCASRYDALKAQIAQQQEELAMLRTMAADKDGDETANDEGGESTSSPPPPPQAYGYSPGLPTAPIAINELMARDAQEAALPSGFAWMSEPSEQVCSSAYKLKLTNRSKFFWGLALNGRDMTIEGRPFVMAPGQHVWLCLPNAGEQEFIGIGYLNRAGMLQREKSFDAQHRFGTWVNDNVRHHDASITDQTPLFNQLSILC